MGPDPSSRYTPPGRKAKVEPTARQRQGAAQIFQMFRSYVDAGFTEEQAMSLIGDVIRPLMSKFVSKLDLDGLDG